MISKQAWKPLLVILCCWMTPALAAINDPCSGPFSLLAVVDRPTTGDSACTVANKKGVIELGIQSQKMYPGPGYQYNLPEAEIRIGLPQHTEFVFLLSNYIHQSVAPHTGYTASVIGVKHRLSATQTLQTAVESLVTLPTGSSNFGSQGLGIAFSGIASYNATPALNLTLMLGVSTQAQPSNVGGQHSTSINPDAVITYSLNDKTDIYLETYGQTKTGPGQGSGFSSDTGIIYLLLPNMTVDAELGQRISGTLGGFSHYIGMGMAIAF
jgi:hypothetical protein